MSQSQEIQFKRKEIVRIFVMLIGVSLVVFSLGIFIGRESPKKEVSQEIKMETTLVEPSVVPPAPIAPVSHEKSAPLPLTGFTIQVALFEDSEEAHKEKERIQALGFPSVSLRQAMVQDRVWHFVDLGLFKDKEKARNYALLLQKKKVFSSYFIRGTHRDEN